MLKCSGRVPCRFAARQLASVSMGLGLRAFYAKQKSAPPCRVNGRAFPFVSLVILQNGFHFRQVFRTDPLAQQGTDCAADLG